MKTEFDTMNELEEAMGRLSDFHDCDKCRGKIVMISLDGLGNQICGYCNQIVKYPKLKDEVIPRELEKINSQVRGKK